ncbi:hypothetical protein BGZ76_003727 [Entomortierella beljakovae]|nr:hypothetical protein BGZ76_003727 [Entomortierella beljakovae]
MRPDPHKQAASRKYHNKVKGRGGAVGATSDSNSSPKTPSHGRGGRGGSRGRGGYRGGSNRDEDKDAADEDDSDGEPRKSYARRKIFSNADRYIEKDEEVTEAEELEQGIDRATLALKEMINRSDQKMTFDPAAYLQFKSEKDIESQDRLEDSQQSRKLLEIRLDDIEKALMTIPIKDRLHLRESDAKALDRDIVGKVSFSTGKPIIPKLVRGQAPSDILIKPSATTSEPIGSLKNRSAYPNSVLRQSASNKASLDDDLDDLLDITKTYGKAQKPPATTPSPAVAKPHESSSSDLKPRLPPLPKGIKSTDASGNTGPKGLPPLKKGAPRASGKKDEEWLDSVLGL